MSDIDSLLCEREQVHGEFFHNAMIAQSIKSHIHPHLDPNVDPIIPEALDMIASKLARIVSGDAMHLDHWIDIAGYATLVANFLTAQRDA
ncbi:hypothetical protein UFOVP6_44 [uncultured Caudovirales phage]|uniref:DUF6378 domain-containing protein n=1 Tax=uncultured Caudovirales phage TaxID=2100421 RepID=A0A6J5KJB4_9CAUD|nr:hypothetical protein UFOVP6_44 [uncultured Caudovirales phage]